MKRGVVVIGICLLANATAQAESFAGTPTVIDAKRVKINGVKHRLADIDAPGLTDRCGADAEEFECGKKAAAEMRRIIRSRPIRCDSLASDEFGEHLSVCFVGGRELNAEMVAAGYGIATSEKYKDFELHAKAIGLGLWRDNQISQWLQTLQ